MATNAEYQDRNIWTVKLNSGVQWELGLAHVLDSLSAPTSVRDKLVNPNVSNVTLGVEQGELLLQVLKGASLMMSNVDVTFAERIYSNSANKPDGIVTVRYEPGVRTSNDVPPEETFSLRVLFE